MGKILYCYKATVYCRCRTARADMGSYFQHIHHSQFHPLHAKSTYLFAIVLNSQWYGQEPAQYDRSKKCVVTYNNTLRHENCDTNQYFICERTRCEYLSIGGLCVLTMCSGLNTWSICLVLIMMNDHVLNSIKWNSLIHYYID